MLARGSVSQEWPSEAWPALLPRACLAQAGRVCRSSWADSQAVKASAYKFSWAIMAPAPSFLSWALGSARPHRWAGAGRVGLFLLLFCPPCGWVLFFVVVVVLFFFLSSP